MGNPVQILSSSSWAAEHHRTLGWYSFRPMYGRRL